MKRFFLLSFPLFLLCFSPVIICAETGTGSFAVKPDRYLTYLESLYNEEFGGFRCYPDPTHGDYFNYWIDDAGKLLIALVEGWDYDYVSKAVDFLASNMYGNYFVQRVVDSRIFYEGDAGSDYYFTNRIVGVGNATKEWGERTAPGLQAHWAFNETSGDNVWESWKNHNGTRYGFDDGWVQSDYGNALEFDGVDAYVEVPHCNDLDISPQSPTPASSITIFARLNVSSNGAIVSKTDGTKTNYLLHIQNNQICFNFTSNGVDKSITTSIEFNRKVTIAVTYNQTDLVLYINGSVSASKLENATLDSCISPVIIGALNPSSRHIQMTLDELWIYSRCLKPTEIQELHERNYVTFPGAYRRACALDSTVFPDSPEYVSGLYLFDLRINETRIFDELQNEPLAPVLAIYTLNQNGGYMLGTTSLYKEVGHTLRSSPQSLMKALQK